MKHSEFLSSEGQFLLSGVPEGYDALVVAEAVTQRSEHQLHLHVTRDDARMAVFSQALNFFAPGITTLEFPAWDCLPYDRVSPRKEIISRRIKTLTALADGPPQQVVVVATINAILQRVPPHTALEVLRLPAGSVVDLPATLEFFSINGFERVGTVREPGEYAVRGSLIDIFPPGNDLPVRLDLLGDELETIRNFDPITQRSTGDPVSEVRLLPANEIFFDAEAISRFRGGYLDQFGAVYEDPLYIATSEGRRQPGIEHWLPLFHTNLETFFDYLPSASVTLDHEAIQIQAARLELIQDYFEARTTFLQNATNQSKLSPYRPLPPEQLYLTSEDMDAALAGRVVGQFSPFNVPTESPSGTGISTIHFEGRRSADFAAMRADSALSSGSDRPFEVVTKHIRTHQELGRQVLVTTFSEGSKRRVERLLNDNRVVNLRDVQDWQECQSLDAATVALAVLPIENGFVADGIALITEQDILGERIIRPRRKATRSDDIIADISEIEKGDLVVHVDHGIGRYDGLETLDVAGAPHDCLGILYAGNDRLYLPVENVDLLSRYGSEDTPATLDRLGSAAWQARVARTKDRLQEMAGELIQLAATRTTQSAPVLDAPSELMQEFASGFPFAETEDQVEAIEKTLSDLQSGQPTDRLVCGDVGFGKTEVALRAAFSTVMSGAQVAVIVPTTLLCRQHLETFERRFQHTAVVIEQLSRLVPAKKANSVREGMARGSVDIVIGTHALLGKLITFNNLGLVIVDEEQRFGVAHKEKLKALKANVHVLTLTATPIPRTFQMALSGVKELSLIRTPPVDRLAVRTFTIPYDPVMIREAIMREHFRGGQVFFVCPRISDLDDIAEDLRQTVPEIKFVVAHGRMGSRALEQVASEFYSGSVDLLLSTQIIESGLDIPSANTIIIHRADRYGLAQLHQLRGRIGRSKLRGYCYLLLPPDSSLTEPASKRLEVLQALDTLGAGFALASHDLDIRGAGNLLGAEQSGHIREVGVELYQHMLEEAVSIAKGTGPSDDQDWVPSINLGIPVMLPENYVSDLGVRLSLYRRIARLETQNEIESFAAEMIDRFGQLPTEAENLLQIVGIKRSCRTSGIEKLDAGTKGATISFREGKFANPDGLVRFVVRNESHCRLRPDLTLVWQESWPNPDVRLRGVRNLVRTLEEIQRK